jgi:hypothetical protein
MLAGVIGHGGIVSQDAIAFAIGALSPISPYIIL